MLFYGDPAMVVLPRRLSSSEHQRIPGIPRNLAPLQEVRGLASEKSLNSKSRLRCGCLIQCQGSGHLQVVGYRAVHRIVLGNASQPIRGDNPP